MSNSRRDHDLRILGELLENTELRETEREAFADMKQALVDEYHQLTEKQRAWVMIRHGELFPQYENLVSRGLVPRGREVETPPTLRNLPKHPPGRMRVSPDDN